MFIVTDALKVRLTPTGDEHSKAAGTNFMLSCTASMHEGADPGLWFEDDSGAKLGASATNGFVSRCLTACLFFFLFSSRSPPFFSSSSVRLSFVSHFGVVFFLFFTGRLYFRSAQA